MSHFKFKCVHFIICVSIFCIFCVIWIHLTDLVRFLNFNTISSNVYYIYQSNIYIFTISSWLSHTLFSFLLLILMIKVCEKLYKLVCIIKISKIHKNNFKKFLKNTFVWSF